MGPVDEVVCARCGDGPLLAGTGLGLEVEITATVDAWLEGGGWWRLVAVGGFGVPWLRARDVAVHRVDPALRAATVDRLRARRVGGQLTSADVRRTAAGLGVDERTVWRWLARDRDDPVRRCYELIEDDIAAFYAWRGNVAAAHRARVRGGATGLPSLATFQRAFAAQLSPGERAAAVDGVEGRRRHEVFLRWVPDRRNALWEGDHKELPVLVMAPRARQPRKPWVTLFVEAYSRLIVGWALSLHPTSAHVLAALRAGIVVDPVRGPFGGLPERLRPDNGLEFAAAALRRSCAALGRELAPTPAYTPHGKGKVERVNRTLDQEFLCGLPFYTEGPRGADGHLFGPDAAPMRLELFCQLFAEWVTAYNTERVHAELGETPLQRWQRDATPLREVPTEQSPVAGDAAHVSVQSGRLPHLARHQRRRREPLARLPSSRLGGARLPHAPDHRGQTRPCHDQQHTGRAR